MLVGLDKLMLLDVTGLFMYFDKISQNILSSPIGEGLIYGITIGTKASIMVFVFIWVRASFPRIRFDQLMSFSWTILLPVVVAFIVIVPCIIYAFEIISSNISLL